jgi:hypothetical protein
MRELNNVKTFAESAPEFAQMWKDYYNQCQAENGVKGKVFSTEFSKDEKEKAINKAFAELVEKKSKYSVSDFNNVEEFASAPTIRAFADSIMNNMIDMVLPETLIQSIGYFCDFKFGGWGDSFQWDVENNALYTVSMAGQRLRTAPAQILRGTTTTLAPYNHNVTVETNLADVMANRVMLAPQVMKATRSMESQMRNEAYDAFTTVMDSATMPTALQVQNYTENSLLTLCQTVTAYNQGRKAVIVGTPVALKSVLPSNSNYRYMLEDDYVKLGNVQVFNGYDVLPLDQVADYTSTAYGLKLKDNRLYVISPASDKIVKVAVGSTYSHTDAIYDNANLAQMSTLNKAWATGVVTNSVAGEIKLS